MKCDIIKLKSTKEDVKTDEEKEELAVQLIEIVSTSKTEQEMIIKSQKLIETSE